MATCNVSTSATTATAEPMVMEARLSELAHAATMEVDDILNDLIMRLAVNGSAKDATLMRGMLIRARTLNGIVSSAFDSEGHDLDDIEYQVLGPIPN